ncbi:MAG: phosphotransferase [Taibaiella sp.]|nr:phosphotransferase [Taibaiella sp.]
MTPDKTQSQIASIIEALYEEHFGVRPQTVEPLPVSGSDRRYYRLTAGTHIVIGTYNSNVAENNTFFYITELFRKNQVNVPEIYGMSRDRRAYLQQDLGKVSLFDLVTTEGFTEDVRKLYHKALAMLARAQWVAGREADYKHCFAARQFDERTIISDLLYFKYYFADLQNIPYDRLLLIKEMEELSKDLGRTQPQTLMYRDFQSRNIMVQNGKIFFIDYQGAMQGPPQYDIASLLWQARAQLPKAWKDDLLNGYISALQELNIPRMDEIYFRRGYVQYVLVRLLQVLGAYGFRGLLQHKAHFINSISPALSSLNAFLAAHPQTPAYPELRNLLEKISSPEMQAKYAVTPGLTGPKLKVEVMSFSYKNGIPQFGGEHGGGYVFDCRGILNPGRYEAYKYYTGNDDVVKQFLERETKMPEFMNHVTGLVAINAEDYIARDFDRLGIAFGCTGGQHRSVYAANNMADYLQKRYNIEVTVTHLNEKKWVLQKTMSSPQAS